MLRVPYSGHSPQSKTPTSVIEVGGPVALQPVSPDYHAVLSVMPPTPVSQNHLESDEGCMHTYCLAF